MAAKKPAASSAKNKTKSKTSKTAPRSSSRSSNKKNADKTSKAGDKLVTIDRRRRNRRGEEAEATNDSPVPAEQIERRKKVPRRRQIDPTTCERDYSNEEVEFMNAMDEYKRTSGRMFPTCSEVLEVIRGLGYVQLSPQEQMLVRDDETTTPEQRIEAVTDVVDELVEDDQ